MLYAATSTLRIGLVLQKPISLVIRRVDLAPPCHQHPKLNRTTFFRFEHELWKTEATGPGQPGFSYRAFAAWLNQRPIAGGASPVPPKANTCLKATWADNATTETSIRQGLLIGIPIFLQSTSCRSWMCVYVASEVMICLGRNSRGEICVRAPVRSGHPTNRHFLPLKVELLYENKLAENNKDQQQTGKAHTWPGRQGWNVHTPK